MGKYKNQKKLIRDIKRVQRGLRFGFRTGTYTREQLMDTSPWVINSNLIPEIIHFGTDYFSEIRPFIITKRKAQENNLYLGMNFLNNGNLLLTEFVDPTFLFYKRGKYYKVTSIFERL